MKNNTGWSARASAMGVLLLVPVLLLAIACSTAGLAQTPEATTAPEETAAPATDAPAESAAPPADGGTDSGTDSGADSGGESGSDDGVPTWAWVLIAGALGVVFFGFIALLRRGSSGDSAADQSKWHGSALEAYAASAAIRDVVAANLSADGLGDAADVLERRWEGARRRINDRTFELRALEAKTEDPEALALVRQLVAGLSALRSAVDSHLSLRTREDAEKLTTEQIAQSEALLSERLSQFGQSLDAFKAYVDKNG